MTTKNLCAKTVKREDAYEVWESFDGSWTWYVLKKYQVAKPLLVERGIVPVSSDDLLSPADTITDSGAWLVSLSPQLKIAQTVVVPDAVFVVDCFGRKELPAKVALHDKTVLGYIYRTPVLPGDEDKYVTIFRFPSAPLVVPRVEGIFESASLAENAADGLRSSTLASVLTALRNANIARPVAPPATAFVANLATDWDTSFSSGCLHVNSVARYEEAEEPYARWFCDVVTPYCPNGELGDVYVSDVVNHAARVR